MRRSLFVLAIAVMALVAAILPTGAVVGTDSADTTTVVRGSALVRLVGQPISSAAKTKPAPGKKINFNSTAVKSYRAQLSARRNEFKKWLQANAPKARVTSEYDTALNAVAVKLNGTSLSTIRESNLVASAQLQGAYRKAAHADPDLDIVDAPEGWAAAGSKGEGVLIGIIDSGIAQDHPCFDGTAYADLNIAHPGDTTYTNDKVVIAKVFSQKAKSRGYTPEAVDSHGTHVAGIAACEEDTPSAIEGVTLHPRSGVAPKALLANYNVFPGTEASATSESILNAMEAAARDGVDVINMSLGDIHPNGRQDLLTMAVDNLDIGGIVNAVSNGNEGPGHYTVGTPGSAARALSAGSSDVGHNFVQQVGVGGTEYVAVRGDFGEPANDVTAPLEVVPGTGANGLDEACSALSADLTGNIALLARGTCDFTVKMRNAQNAGAVGVIMSNRIPGEPPFVMSHNGLEPQPTIPGYMVSMEDGAAIKTKNGQSATLFRDGEYKVFSAQRNNMSDFSSQGPTDVDYRVKPDLVAPGGDILSSVPGDCPGGCWEFLGGTSMAAPHLAGAAAVVIGDEPTWSPVAVRSAITNTANRSVLKTTDGQTLTDVQIEGAGLLDLDAAANAVAGLDPVSTSFGAVPSIAGWSLTKTVRVTNLSTAAKSFTVAADAPFTVSPATLSLAPGETGAVRVTFAPPRGTPRGDVQGYLKILTGGTEVAHSVLYAFLR